MEAEGHTRDQNARALTVAEERKYTWLRNVAVVGIMFGLLSVTASFGVAYLGFQTLSSCNGQRDCMLSAAQHKLAIREYKVSAATLFPCGALLVTVGLYLNRKAMTELKRRKSDVLISTVTQCGLLKTPTPASIHASDLLAVVPISVDAELQDDLPEYDVTVNVCPETLATDTITARKSRNTEAADALDIDEDVAYPPPSYEEALELVENKRNTMKE